LGYPLCGLWWFLAASYPNRARFSLNLKYRHKFQILLKMKLAIAVTAVWKIAAIFANLFRKK
jgi:hypothetical protein